MTHFGDDDDFFSWCSDPREKAELQEQRATLVKLINKRQKRMVNWDTVKADAAAIEQHLWSAVQAAGTFAQKLQPLANELPSEIGPLLESASNVIADLTQLTSTISSAVHVAAAPARGVAPAGGLAPVPAAAPATG